MIKSCLAPRDSQTANRSIFGAITVDQINLPLKAVHCEGQFDGPIALVKIVQLYVNESASAVNVRYTFPLPGDAAIYACEMLIGQTRIVAKVKPEAEARKEFADKVREGSHAVLVESARKNIFCMDLGNVQPGEEVEIELSYFDVLDQSVEGSSRVGRLRIPLCPGIPYIPGQPLLRSSRGLGVPDTDQVPDASRITPPRIFARDSRAASLSVEISAPASGTLTSPSHKIHLASISGTLGDSDKTQVGLDMDQEVPDRDFILEWRLNGAEQVYGLRNGSHAVLGLAAPTQTIRSANLSQDVYFLVDRSGSMQGVKWSKSLEALKRFVAILGEQDRIDIVFFESSFTRFSDQLETRGALLADEKFRHLEKYLHTAGGTELLQPLQDLLSRIKANRTTRMSTIVLITDGQVGNSAPILDVLGTAPEIVVHTFGIDTAVNDDLLKEIARKQNGWCVLKTPNEDIAGAVQSLAERVASPAYTSIRVAAPWTAAGFIPPLYCGDVLSLPLKLNGDVSSSEIVVHATSREGQPHQWTVPLQTTSSQAPALLWAKEQIDELLRAKKNDEAVLLACQSNLSCPGAACVAWDSVRNTAAKVLVNQPSLVPAQWDMLQSVAGGGGALYSGNMPSGVRRKMRSPSAPLPPMPASAPMPIPQSMANLDRFESVMQDMPSAPAPGSRNSLGKIVSDIKGFASPKPKSRTSPPLARMMPAPAPIAERSAVSESAPEEAMDLDLLAWESNVRRLALFQVPEQLPLLKKLIEWARGVKPELRDNLYEKLIKMSLAEQETEVNSVLTRSVVK